MAKPPGVRDMVGKSKNKTVIPSVKVREIAAAVSTNKGDKLPNPAHRMDLTNLATIQTRTESAVPVTDNDSNDQSNNILTELERRVEEMSISSGVDVGGAPNAGE